MDQICLRSIFFLRVLLLRVNGAPDCASVVGPVGCAPLFVSNRGHRALIPDAPFSLFDIASSSRAMPWWTPVTARLVTPEAWRENKDNMA